MDDEWDLNAVVRSCATVSSAAASDSTPAAATATATATTNATATTATGVTLISFDDGRSADEQPWMFSNIISFSMESGDSELHDRKRKSKNIKRVVEMKKEELSNDGWAWRKYGQKAIKGSPYQRNYYRCSTTKECKARKQVERSPTEPSSFMVSYSGDHLHSRPTHLSSLAGTTRRSTAVATDSPEQPPCSSSSPASTSSFSPATSLKADETEMNDEDIDELI